MPATKKVVKNWSTFLAVKGFCTADDETGNRPCDNGMYCDKCEQQWVQDAYKAWLTAVDK